MAGAVGGRFVGRSPQADAGAAGGGRARLDSRCAARLGSAMAAPMIPPETAPDFLAAHGWQGAEIRPLAGDASFRRYFRVHRGGGTAVLMDAPPEHEDLGPFLTVAEHLLDRGFAPPRPLAVDREQGLLLLEDCGDEKVTPLLAREPEREREVYAQAVDILARLAAAPAPADLAPYGEEAMAREVLLFTDWYGPALGLDLDARSFLAAWREAWGGVLEAVGREPGVGVCGYYARKLMVVAAGGLRPPHFPGAPGRPPPL